jgi:hypothetical protein
LFVKVELKVAKPLWMAVLVFTAWMQIENGVLFIRTSNTSSCKEFWGRKEDAKEETWVSLL